MGDVVKLVMMSKKLVVEDKDTVRNFNDFKNKFPKIINQSQINVNEKNRYWEGSWKMIPTYVF